MHALPQPALTVEDFYALPDDDGAKHELQAGVLLAEPLPGMQHGWMAARIAALLARHVQEHRLGAVFSNDTGYILARSPDTVRGPDVSFVSGERLGTTGLPAGPFPGAPDLAVEVLSPSNTPAAIRAKVADYLAAGTHLVWIVDPAGRTVTTYRTLLAPRVLAEPEVLDGEDVVPGFRISVAELLKL